MQDIVTMAMEKAKADIVKAQKELEIIQSLPIEVQQMKFLVCSPERSPFLSFKGGSFDELQKLKELFPAMPQYWCDNTHGTREQMERKTAQEYVVNGKTIKGIEYYESIGKAFPLASPYVVNFTKLSYPENGKVTVKWDTGNFRIWYEMNARQYAKVTQNRQAVDVHLRDEQNRHNSRNPLPMCTTPYLKTGTRIDYWGNHSTCYCKTSQDVEAYEKAIFFGE